jgi:hypothetical protein
MSLNVDTNIAAGNATIEAVAGNTIRFRPDVRDTTEPWFYWNLRVRGCEGRTLRFELTVPHSLTVRGAAVSRDGWEWNWIPEYDPKEWAFRYACGADDELQFSLAMPYTYRNLERWLARHDGNPALTVHKVCGRSPWLRVGRQDGREQRQAIVTCRHHCCEMMASYALEGLLDAVLDGPMRETWTFYVVPMVDFAGVEAGDQGKSRAPHDHNRDYTAAPIYPEVAGIMDLARRCDDRLRFAFDLHCPWVRGEYNEHIYIVGSENAGNAARQLVFAAKLEAARTGPLPYRAAGTLPFGTAWNTTKGMPVSFGRWMIAHAPGTPTVASFEIPYANAEGVPVIAASARAFGTDLARAVYASV